MTAHDFGVRADRSGCDTTVLLADSRTQAISKDFMNSFMYSLMSCLDIFELTTKN